MTSSLRAVLTEMGIISARTDTVIKQSNQQNQNGVYFTQFPWCYFLISESQHQIYAFLILYATTGELDQASAAHPCLRLLT